MPHIYLQVKNFTRDASTYVEPQIRFLELFELWLCCYIISKSMPFGGFGWVSNVALHGLEHFPVRSSSGENNAQVHDLLCI